MNGCEVDNSEREVKVEETPRVRHREVAVRLARATRLRIVSSLFTGEMELRLGSSEKEGDSCNDFQV